MEKPGPKFEMIEGDGDQVISDQPTKDELAKVASTAKTQQESAEESRRLGEDSATQAGRAAVHSDTALLIRQMDELRRSRLHDTDDESE